MTRDARPAARATRAIPSAPCRSVRGSPRSCRSSGSILVLVLTLNLLGVNLSDRWWRRARGPDGGNGGTVEPTAGPVRRRPARNRRRPSRARSCTPSRGDIWIQTGDKVRQLTTTGQDSMPSWSPGRHDRLLHPDDRGDGPVAVQGNDRHYQMTVPNIMSIAGRRHGPGRTGCGPGKFKKNGKTWFYWMREPVMSPNGKTFALVSDAPDPTQVGRRPPVLDAGHGQVEHPGRHRDRAPRPPGSRPGVPTARCSSMFATAATAPRATPSHLSLGPGQEDLVAGHRSGLPRAVVLARTGATSRRPGPTPSGRTSSSSTRLAVARCCASRTDGASWAPVWSPRRRRDRVLPHRGPDRGPADGRPRRHRARTGRSRRSRP